jgi:hypothetical protein
MTNTPGLNLTDAFYLRQEQLRADLNLGDISNHPVTKGDDSELNWFHMLDKLLPIRYRVAKAFVFDVNGGISEQIDIVIHDRHFSPLLIEIGDTCYIPAESVYAAIEVKPNLDKGNIEYAAGKIESVRRLHRTSVPIPHAGGTYDPKVPHHIIGGILTRRSDWNPPFGEPFQNSLRSLNCHGQIDIGCALEHGTFSMRQIDSQPVVEVSQPSNSLITFVMTLIRQLQTMGSAPAIDYDAYLNTIQTSKTQ